MRRLHFWGWTLILVMSLGLQAGNFQGGDALVCTEPVRLEIGVGQVRNLRILLVNVQNIYGIDLQASYDPAVVEVVDTDSKQPGIQMTSGEFLKADFTVRNLADNTAGRLSYVVTQLNPTAPVNGKGVILSVQFRGKLRDKSTKLTFTRAMLADRHGNKQSVTTQEAELVVVRQKSSTPTPTSLTNGNFIPAVPSWSPPTNTPPINQPTTQPSPTASQAAPAAQPGDEAAWKGYAWVPESRSGLSGRALIYIRVSGLLGVLLLSGLTVWLLLARHRKKRTGKAK